MFDVTFTNAGYCVQGKEAFLNSAEFHYFRVPREDWKRRMELFREAGGNTLATYVPWMIHEPAEGDIRFGDIPNRDLCAFLDTAKEVGLSVILRPGPYQYSELVNAGLPDWLLDNYPEVLARDLHGNIIKYYSVSYLHPVLLEKVRRYYRTFADIVRPYMAENGGPVCMLQVDNEMAGIHVWYGSLDYNRDTMGFGREDGRYAAFLRRKYSTVAAANEAYGTDFATFADFLPLGASNTAQSGTACDFAPTEGQDPADPRVCRRLNDYETFYRGTLGEYAALLASWLREDGLNAPICHNSANPEMNTMFPETVQAMGKNFLLGSDHYYILNSSWPQNNPTPQYALRMLISCDTLRALGMPPTVLEMPGGSICDTPPILPNDLLACYMTNMAMGMRGVNYYVYTGGPNFPGTAATCDVYDYNAHVHADGTLNETYASLKTFGLFMRDHAWLQNAVRESSVQVGFTWDSLRRPSGDCKALPCSNGTARTFLEKGILYSLMCSPYSPQMKLLTGGLDPAKPLIVPCPSALDATAQKAIVDFAKNGGRVILGPAMPQVDSDLNACTLLRDAVGPFETVTGERCADALRMNGFGNFYGATAVTLCKTLPDGAESIAADPHTGLSAGFRKQFGAGTLVFLGFTWDLYSFEQVRMLEHILESFGTQKTCGSSNRNWFTTLQSDDKGHRVLTVMNLYSCPQKGSVSVFTGTPWTSGEIELAPMEVRTFDL